MAKSLGDILKAANDMIKDLAELTKEKQSEMKDCQQKIMSLESRKAQARTESDQAARIQRRLSKLIS